MAGREENVRIFEDSMKLCKKNEKLKESIKNSALRQKLYDVTFKVENGIIDEKTLGRYEKLAEVMILGAFGCGAFENSPEVVATSYKELVEEFRYRFETIEFAVYCPPNKTLNYDVFKRVIGAVAK